MNDAADRQIGREQKDVFFDKKNIDSMVLLHRLCMRHEVAVLETVDTVTLRLTESSRDLPNLSYTMAKLGLLKDLAEAKRRAYLHDLETLECP